MLGFGEVRPESHRYPFLASLLCIPSQDAIDESPTTTPPDDGAAGRLREARGLARMPEDAIAARAEALASKLPPDGWRVAAAPQAQRRDPTERLLQLQLQRTYVEGHCES